MAIKPIELHENRPGFGGAASAQVFAWWAQARVRAPDAAATGDRAPHGG